MGAYEVWTDRFILSLRALGIAFMVVVFGWILVSVTANFVDAIGKGIAAASLIGYAVGRLHANASCTRRIDRSRSKSGRALFGQP